MTIKYTCNFHSMAIQNLPKLGFLVRKNHLATLDVAPLAKKRRLGIIADPCSDSEPKLTFFFFCGGGVPQL
jgi:hypothetical protein